MNNLSRIMVLILVAGLMVACGTRATPVFESHDEEVDAESQAVEDGDDEVEVVVVPTATVEPPTATPTDEPTATVEPPTATPTEEPTEAPSDPIARLVGVRDATNGEMLFNQFYAETGFSCATCHQVMAPGTLIGPSMYGIASIAGTRVDGQVAERYLYNSIVSPNEFVVEGFVEGVMPQTWHEILTDIEIYDIIAYLMTLEG